MCLSFCQVFFYIYVSIVFFSVLVLVKLNKGNVAFIYILLFQVKFILFQVMSMTVV